MNEVLEKFKLNAELTTAKVEFVNRSEVAKFISNLIVNEKEILVSLKDKTIITELPQTTTIIKEPSSEDLKNVTTCLTDSVAGIIETGSVLINNDSFASYFTMLTQTHIVILNSKNLYQKPRDIFQDSTLSKTSTFSAITGPSATADMGSLVRGVHGPEKLIIIISIEDE